MLNDYQKGSIFGAVLIAVVFSFAISAHQQVQGEQSPKEANSVSQSSPEDKAFWADPINPLTLLLVLVGAIQAGLFVWQLGLIRKGLADTKEAADAAKESTQTANASLALSRQTAEHQLRAYVMVDKAVTVNFGPKPTAQVVIKNFGATPAYGFTIWTVVDVATDPIDGPPEPPTGAVEAKGDLGPGSFVHTWDTSERVIPVEEIQAVQDGRAGFYVFGKAAYKDVFGKEHSTKFCFIYGGRSGPHPTGAMAQYKDWNEST
jgi:hypothetical protein